MEWFVRYVVARQFRGAGSAMNADRDGGKRRTDVQDGKRPQIFLSVIGGQPPVTLYMRGDRGDDN